LGKALFVQLLFLKTILQVRSPQLYLMLKKKKRERSGKREKERQDHVLG
jgi:hypothetical protein